MTGADVDRMVDKLLFAGPDLARKRSTFWVLLGLAAAITTVGEFSDSTATVIGEMIVAPLMTPILGTALALGDHVRRDAEHRFAGRTAPATQRVDDGSFADRTAVAMTPVASRPQLSKARNERSRCAGRETLLLPR